MFVFLFVVPNKYVGMTNMFLQKHYYINEIMFYPRSPTRIGIRHQGSAAHYNRKNLIGFDWFFSTVLTTGQRKGTLYMIDCWNMLENILAPLVWHARVSTVSSHRGRVVRAIKFVKNWKFRAKFVQCERGFKQSTSYWCSILDHAGKWKWSNWLWVHYQGTDGRGFSHKDCSTGSMWHLNSDLWESHQ